MQHPNPAAFSRSTSERSESASPSATNWALPRKVSRLYTGTASGTILRALEDLTKRLGVGTLLIGKPLHMSGDESRQSEYTREFAERLARQTSLPVVFWDERLTSAEAERMLRDGGASLDQKKKSVDRLAATLLLESYLEFRRASAQAEEEKTNG